MHTLLQGLSGRGRQTQIISAKPNLSQENRLPANNLTPAPHRRRRRPAFLSPLYFYAFSSCCSFDTRCFRPRSSTPNSPLVARLANSRSRFEPLLHINPVAHHLDPRHTTASRLLLCTIPIEHLGHLLYASFPTLRPRGRTGCAQG
jgi:hypothetical protein